MQFSETAKLTFLADGKMREMRQGKVFEIEWIWKEFTFGAIYLNV